MTKKNTYTESHKGKNYGIKYDNETYSKKTYDYKVWELEKLLLKRILPRNKKLRILDFACGTGRISEYLEELKFKNITGIDVSDEMLKIADKKLKSTDLLNIDVNDKNKLIKKNNIFDIIVCFRFFLNADQELRTKTLNSLKELLRDDSELIFNIHGNTFSYRFIEVLFRNIMKKISAILFRRDEDIFRYRKQLSVYEVRKLIKENNYDIQQIYSYAFLPSILSNILPYKIWFYIESLFISDKFLYGSHLIFICKKNKKI